MKIYSMTATFGKLSHETLTLQPGLNVVQAPNEWGKSTWCAFLINMLYGIDTRERSTASTLADKERYAPWSGAPMSGRLDICWNGRDITIERNTRGRLPLGDFRAYETATGIDIPELTATNCGQMLLGVERSVFTQAGFLKLSDLPVQQNDALRRRLNDLVTTGDESGAGEKLAKKLKDIKNKCRFNKTGLLPQAETQQQHLLAQISELQELSHQKQTIQTRQKELEIAVTQLENHRTALRYAAAQEDIRRVEQAKQEALELSQKLQQQKVLCQTLPSRSDLLEKQRQAQLLREQSSAVKLQSLPQAPQAPVLPETYREQTPLEISSKATADFDRQLQLESQRKKQNKWVSVCFTVLVALLAGLLAAAIAVPGFPTVALILGGGMIGLCAIAVLLGSTLTSRRCRRELLQLYEQHPGLSPDLWIQHAQSCVDALSSYNQQLESFRLAASDLEDRKKELEENIAALTQGLTLEAAAEQWTAELAAWDTLDSMDRDLKRLQAHVDDLAAIAKTPVAPEVPDTLTYSTQETDSLLTTHLFEQRQLQLKLGQNEGRAEALGLESDLRQQLKAVNQRIARLEDVYAATELAQRALQSATTELQRRFAPRISKRAQELFHKLTQGRYQRLTLGEDLSLNAAAENEDTLRASQWRSDGTVDQLYLALRLAVAEELTPQAPLILDDALVRFDDARLALALDILQEASENKQVIIFTCQNREKKLLERK